MERNLIIRTALCKEFDVLPVDDEFILALHLFVDRTPGGSAGSFARHGFHTRRILRVGLKSFVRRFRPGQLRQRGRRHRQLSARCSR